MSNKRAEEDQTRDARAKCRTRTDKPAEQEVASQGGESGGSDGRPLMPFHRRVAVALCVLSLKAGEARQDRADQDKSQHELEWISPTLALPVTQQFHERGDHDESNGEVHEDRMEWGDEA